MIGKENKKNAIIWGFSSESASQSIESLKEKNIIDIKAWIGDNPGSTHDIYSFFTGKFKKDAYYGSAGEIYNDILNSTFPQFVDMMSRHSFYTEKSYHDNLNIFNILFDLFSNLLITSNIDVILFSNIPHEGPDYILYKIAKKMDIKTIFFYQTIFPDKFFYLFDIDDFGKFEQISGSNEIPGIKVENRYEKELFYMSNVNNPANVPFSLLSNSLWSLLSSIFLKENIYLLRRFSQRVSRYETLNNCISPSHGSRNDSSSKKNIVSIFINLAERTLNFLFRNLQRYFNHMISKREFLRILEKQIDLTGEFIYFPLHLQPELTTSALGDIYVDQLLAIERLSEIIPDEWSIYVKENPKQTELMRGKWFFTRLHSIKKAKVIPPDFDTYSLMKNCVFVSTITGTAGWEAISGGKNVLVFGNPWYKSLPGVFSYNNNFKLEDILNYRINHDELEKALNIMLSKAGTGVIDESYSILVENFDAKENGAKIAALIEKII